MDLALSLTWRVVQRVAERHPSRADRSLENNSQTYCILRETVVKNDVSGWYSSDSGCLLKQIEVFFFEKQQKLSSIILISKEIHS